MKLYSISPLVLLILLIPLELFAQDVSVEISYSLRGPFTNDRLSDHGINLPGDLDGDNIPDFIVNTSSGDSGEGLDDNVGLSRVISGASGMILYDIRGPFSGDTLNNNGQYLPGDLNGDGIPDFAVASGLGDSSEGANDNVGLVRVVSGIDGNILFDARGKFTMDAFAFEKLVLPGDVNGDGIPDLSVITSRADTSEGANDNVGSVITLSGADGIELYEQHGPFPNDNAGRQGAVVPGDLNGDGVNDIVTASELGDSSSGANDDVGLVQAISGSDGIVLFNVRGPFPMDQLGRDGLHLPGDLNGDTVPDILAASEVGDSVNGANDDVGLVQAISGSDGSILYSLRGPFPGDKFGSSMFSFPGDLNGDGRPDFITGSSSADSSNGANDFVGLLQAISGVDGSVLYSLRGPYTGDNYGFFAAVLPGDLDGDGVPDLVTEASNGDSSEGANDNVGLVRVVSGASGNVLYDVHGPFTEDVLGGKIFLPGDISGDGIPDLLVKTGDGDSSSGANDDVGLIRAVSGSDGSVLYDLRGPFSDDQLGSGDLALPGDINGDNVPDFIATTSTGDSSEGAGDDVGLVRGFSGANGNVLFDLRGPFTNDRYGSGSLILPGDLNNDGVPDFLVRTAQGDSNEGADDNVGLVQAIIIDQCPADGSKTVAGQCGCGVPDTDSNANGIADCMANLDLKEQIARQISMIRSLKFTNTPSAKKNKKRKKAQKQTKKDIKTLASEIVAFIDANAGNIVLANVKANISKLSRAARRKSKKATRTSASLFRKNKKKAIRILKKLNKAIA